MAVNLSEVTGRLGIEGLENLSGKEVATDFMPAAVAGLSDGDLAVIHEPYAGDLARLYGDTVYNNGEVAQKVFEVCHSNGLAPGAIYDFQRFAANYFSAENGPFYQSVGNSFLRVFPEAVTIDDNPLALARPPRVVVDYGACLSSRSLVSDQIAFLAGNERPFTYVPLTRLHFTNQALMRAYDRQLGAGSADVFVDKHLYIGREDGIGNATDEMIAIQTAGGGPVEVADVIFCKGSEHTTADDLRKGIANAYTIAKEAGMLVIRSFGLPSADEIGTDEIASWAFDAGFKEQTTLEYTAVSHPAGIAYVHDALSFPREIKTIVTVK